ncbi:DUF1501 domain-containing protein [Massilia oculi]|uniref:DUF1501 domain-containing protein n=1 Tax=Massilia hydrophila TaxID=3044279 RepID=A0ABS7YCH8_9BURK|nr:DUF1501 domain-containing protein [Massilia oculi]MCA1856702.1 DUF1501 domain-containing protein [Massilia oculi]
MDRRHFLRFAGAAPVVSMLGASSLLESAPAHAAGDDYRALVVVFLSGGNDGLNSLVPTDGAYNDYAGARPELAITKSVLATLSGASGGHTYGMHPALAPLAPLYNSGRLAWIANVGPLVAPATARQVIERSVPVPSFLLSHSDQIMWQQGWLGDSDASGWAGRALELLPTALRNQANAVTMNTDRTLVLGRNSPVSFLSPGESRYWGQADLAQPQAPAAQALNRMARWQFSNRYQAEYASTLGRSVSESTLFTQIALAAREPAGNFGGDDLSRALRKLSSLMPVFKQRGFKRQVFLVQWGGFDTHAIQRGTGPTSQDAQLAILGRAMQAFDQANIAAGLDQNVVSLTMSDFGRTLRQASGGGSDHAWGNHWFAMGGPVRGCQVVGTLPSLTLGGPDDADPNGGGRFVPTISTDQVGATLMQWLGLPASDFHNVFPNLANFSQKTINLLHA